MSKTDPKAAKIIRIICRLLLGITFIFSSLVKAIDPLGTTYKIQDYLQAFGPFFATFTGIAFPLALLLITIEFIIGINLLLNLHLHITSYVALAFMLVMTPLTFYLAIANPVQDCGCFGDAIILTNWQTFYKNIILLILVIAQLITLRTYHSFWRPVPAWIVMALFAIAILGFEIYNYRHLPIVDFRPYKVGNDIIEQMTIPEDAPTDEYLTTFIFEKDGIEQEFTLENYPKDSSWHFVDQVSTLVSKGYEPPIHDFVITDSQGDDITYDILENQGYTLLLIAYDINRASTRYADKINEVYRLATFTETPFYAITASLDEDIDKYALATNAQYSWYKCDPITLKTIVRSNPGLLLLHGSTIVAKWNARDIPSPSQLQQLMNGNN